MVGGAEYLRLFRLSEGFEEEEEEEDGGARESLRASDNSAMLRLCRGTLGEVPVGELFTIAGMIPSLLLLNATSGTILCETLELLLSSVLGGLFNIGHPVTVDSVDCLKEVGAVLVEEEEGEVKEVEEGGDVKDVEEGG